MESDSFILIWSVVLIVFCAVCWLVGFYASILLNSIRTKTREQDVQGLREYNGVNRAVDVYNDVLAQRRKEQLAVRQSIAKGTYRNT